MEIFIETKSTPCNTGTGTCPISLIGVRMSEEIEKDKGKSMLEDLFVEIEKSHTFELANNPSEIDEFEKHCDYKLPEDLKEFYRRYKTVKLFDDEWGASYRFVFVNEIKVTGYDIYGDSANPNDYLWPKSWFTVCDVLDGNYISVDLSSRNGNECNYIDCFHETYGTPGESKVIAKSFRELLERSLTSGREQFYLDNDFKDYGDALEITPETAIFRISNRNASTTGGWMVNFYRSDKSYRKYFRDVDYGNKEKSYEVAKLYVEENRKQ